MRKLLSAIAALALLTVSASSAFGATIVFSGGDIVADASLTVNTGATPVVGDGFIQVAPGIIRTYGSSGNPAGFNNWLAGLSSTEGIKEFNLWLQDGASNQAAMWGEEIALADPYSSSIVAFASAGWTASVYTLVESDWGAAWAGRKLITYTADSSAHYLRPGSTATFGFTADIVRNSGADGLLYQMWVGSGSLAGHSGEAFFQRAVTARAVPEPTALGLVGLALVLVARRLRR